MKTKKSHEEIYTVRNTHRTMNLFNRLDPVVFISALAIGIFISYVFGPRPDVLFKYPNPQNAHTIVYKDDLNNCYQYDPHVVKCPSDKSKVTQIPVAFNKPNMKEKQRVSPEDLPVVVH